MAEPAFEDLLSRLATIVDELERGELPLERSLAVFEEGVKLSRLAKERLDDAERRVEVLLDSGETRPLTEDER